MGVPIYIDVCAISRPFDDQSYLRIRLETEAVNLILSNVKTGYYKLLISPVHIREIASIPDVFEHIELQTTLNILGESIKVDLSKTKARAKKLIRLGFGVADAAHVAFAEQAEAQFISCDDRLIKKCVKHRINIWCGNPVAFCEKDKLR